MLLFGEAPRHWDRYNYTHLKAEVDKTGEIPRGISMQSLLYLKAERNSPYILIVDIIGKIDGDLVYGLCR